MERKKIGLVLSGGGEKGWIQLGAVEVLEKEKIPFDIITGCSVGGLIGWGLASGFSAKELIAKADVLKDKDIRKPTQDTYAIYDPSVAFDKLKKVFGDKNIEDLPRKFAVVAVDLLSGEEVVLDKGPAIRAVRATTAIPAVFPPIEIEGRLLIDGGILNVLPVDIANNMGAELTIAIDVSGFGLTKFSPKERKMNPVLKRLVRTTRNPYLSAILKRGYLLESLYQSSKIMSAKIRNEKLARSPPTLLLEPIYPKLDGISLTIKDKKLRTKMIEFGREVATSEIENIKNLLALAES